MLARSYVHWPTLDNDIEQLVRNCSKCASVAKDPVKAELSMDPPKFGNPATLVTDNGTQFTSSQIALFCRFRRINHIRTPPFHPQSNGQAERFVDNFKRGLAKLEGEER
ncbi:hypothetical protein TELCIR_16714 [Teladorsagia circumcincta]|uniref:RNA-directed DNA polymerase n=1 Tax=Teladorsagia circumcincta TaxID=45464 RepID=A0A2G9TWD3_TELCI|nr:hypothetical protein TELCIR_16714 [Teladorsagia circumcincta]